MCVMNGELVTTIGGGMCKMYAQIQSTMEYVYAKRIPFDGTDVAIPKAWMNFAMAPTTARGEDYQIRTATYQCSLKIPKKNGVGTFNSPKHWLVVI